MWRLWDAGWDCQREQETTEMALRVYSNYGVDGLRGLSVVRSKASRHQTRQAKGENGNQEDGILICFVSTDNCLHSV